jgi:hypothetical protein
MPLGSLSAQISALSLELTELRRGIRWNQGLLATLLFLQLLLCGVLIAVAVVKLK